MKKSLQLQIEEKARELEELRDIQKFTNTLAGQLEQIEEKLEVMTDGAESVAYILSNWKNVVSAVSLASLGLANHAKRTAQGTEAMPETLVRVKLQQDTGKEDS
ncbi:hypothetical protein OXX59_000597 [Metschnikowia pulcherrima]